MHFGRFVAGDLDIETLSIEEIMLSIKEVQYYHIIIITFQSSV